jgi:hypothetical protein
MRACGAGLRNAEDIRLRRDSVAAGIIRIRLSVAFHTCKEASGVPSCKVAFYNVRGHEAVRKNGHGAQKVLGFSAANFLSIKGGRLLWKAQSCSG